MSAFATLEFEAEGMVPGTRSKILCPKCQGGQSKEISLSLFKDHDGRIAWKCFRASCGYSGNPRGVSGGSDGKRRPEPKYYTHPYEPICALAVYGEEQFTYAPNSRGRWLEERFGFVPNCFYSEEQRRYVLPVRGPEGQLRGHQAYSFEPGAQKCVTYRERVDEPFMHWAGIGIGMGQKLVIVEDWFSAEKVALAGGIGIALLGTNLNPERVDEIKRGAQNKKIALALDADAYAKSVRYVIDYGGSFTPPLRVWKLARDLKYEPVERIRMALQDDRITDFGRDFS